MSSYYYICVLILLYMCRHTPAAYYRRAQLLAQPARRAAACFFLIFFIVSFFLWQLVAQLAALLALAARQPRVAALLPLASAAGTITITRGFPKLLLLPPPLAGR